MQLKPKLKAAGIHLFLSGIVFLVALYLIVFHWYPGFLFAVDGGWQGVRIMAGVHLVLGPLLTLIIFNPTKTRRAILFDFSCIGIAQTAALIWGLYAVHGERPVAVVHWEKSFHPITMKSLRNQGKGLGDLKPFGDGNPLLIYAKPPEDAKGELEVFVNSITQSLAEYEQMQLFQPLAPNINAIAAHQKNVGVLSRHVPTVGPALEALKQGKVGADAWIYIPFHGRYGERILVLNAQGELVGSLPAGSVRPE